MSTTLAFLGEFGDAIDFIFNSRESKSGGAEIGGSQLWDLIVEHLKVSGAAIAVAVVATIPFALWLGHLGRGQAVASAVGNVGRAVPSLALIALLVAFVGTGFLNVTIALALLAIPPILTNTYVGVRQVDRDVVDAARGMGLGGLDIVRRVELPLALPLIFGGIRTSVVNVIATATIAPLAGVTTIGDTIVTDNYGSAGRLGGAIVVAALAVAAEGVFALIQRAVTPAGLRVDAHERAARRLHVPFPRRRMEAA